ncbi:MAG: glycosyltransferase, partial [Candidatus Ranarchaeia archaeon]
DKLNPANFDKIKLRRKYGIDEDKRVVLFLGTPKPHKGLEPLINAMALVENPDKLFMIAGLGVDKYSKKIHKQAKSSLGARYLGLGRILFDQVPEILAISDLVVIPQEKNFATIGQVPAKLFDAMAMAKPIISTPVSDIPKILKNCGWIVEPGNIVQLSKTIQDILGNIDDAEEMGLNARKKMVKEYTLKNAEKKILAILKKYG